MEFRTHDERFLENPNSYLIAITCVIQIHVRHSSLGKKFSLTYLYHCFLIMVNYMGNVV